MEQKYSHTTVLLHEAVDMLNIQESGVYVDCTLGGAGHSRAILDRLGPEGRLIVFDHDSTAWANVPEDDRVMLVKENFQHIERFLRHLKFPMVDGILADLGVSSHHLDTSERGFSYRFSGPLDMRMDQRRDMTAGDVLRSYDEQELVRVFSDYGQVPNSKSLARAIVAHRSPSGWETTDDFLAFLDHYTIGEKVKYRSKVFQALRIEVNEELASLEQLLTAAPRVMNPGARLVIISFHSLEDRIVKNMTRDIVTEVDPIRGQKKMEKNFAAITKKPILPSEEEIKNNKRSRSARMRVLEKI